MIRVLLPLVLLASLWRPTPGTTCGVEPERMEGCTSSALVSRRSYSGPLRVSVLARSNPAADGRFFAGVALTEDEIRDLLYAEAAITYGIEPFVSEAEQALHPSGVLLASGSDRCCQVLTGRIDPAQTHTLVVDYDGSSSAEICVDGHCSSVAIDLGPTFYIEFVCAGVSVNTPGQNPVDCFFTDLEVEEG